MKRLEKINILRSKMVDTKTEKKYLKKKKKKIKDIYTNKSPLANRFVLSIWVEVVLYRGASRVSSKCETVKDNKCNKLNLT